MNSKASEMRRTNKWFADLTEKRTDPDARSKPSLADSRCVLTDYFNFNSIEYANMARQRGRRGRRGRRRRRRKRRRKRRRRKRRGRSVDGRCCSVTLIKFKRIAFRKAKY